MNQKQTLKAVILCWVLWPLCSSAADFEIASQFKDPLRNEGSGPDMVVIPSGLFVLGGGRVGQQGAGMVKIDYLLAVSLTEITNEQYRQFLRASHSAGLKSFPEGNDNFPAAAISWDEAEAYSAWLSRETGHHYRLPSASEWEYAARADTSTTYSWGESAGKNNANCIDCKSKFDGKASPVGSFKPNAWGLYDMHGNVWEWTKDCIDSNAAPPSNGMPKLFGNCDLRELRGGSAQSDSWSIRADARAFALRKSKTTDSGFRVVMEVPSSQQ